MTGTPRLHVEQLEDRLAPATAGSLDPTFGTGGIVTLTQRSDVVDVETAPDGRLWTLTRDYNPVTLVAVGYSVERFESSGALDTTFGVGGIATVPAPLGAVGIDAGLGRPSFVLPLPDGGVLVGGSVHHQGKTDADLAILRLTADGSLDTTFGSGGLAVIPFDEGFLGHDSANAAVVQPDGKIVIAGSRGHNTTLDLFPISLSTSIVARLTPDGQPDQTFGTAGKVVVSFPVGRFDSSRATSVVLQPGGGIVLGGSAMAGGTIVTVAGGAIWEQNLAPFMMRLTSNGQLDSTFGTGGRLLVNLPQSQDTTLLSVELQQLQDGRLLLAAAARTPAPSWYGVAARATSNGQLDGSYGIGGLATTAQGEIVSSASIDPEGRAVFADAVASRLTVHGSIDTRFGNLGKVTLSSLPGLNDSGFRASDVAVQPGGNIVIGGALIQLSRQGTLVRLLGNGEPPGFVPATAGAILAGGAADGTVQVLNSTNGSYTLAGTMTPFPGFGSNVRATIADVTGDGTPDYITGAGPGGLPQVIVFDGKTGQVAADFLPFENSFTGGVFVAAADLDKDGRAEVVVAPDQGGGPRVVVLSIATGGAVTQRASFFGIDDPNFRGGARVALGDVNRDGTPDLAVAAGFLGGPRVALFNGETLLASPARLINDFFAFPEDAATLRNGAFVALGDLDGDGFAEAIFGAGPGGAPRVFALSGARLSGGDVSGAYANPVANFFVAGNVADRGGVRVASKDADGDSRADLAVGSGEGSAANVRVYLGKNFTGAGEPSVFQDIAVFGGAVLPGGVFVG